MCTTPATTFYVCGNGRTDPGEECDDGNTKDFDGCSFDCKRERGACGDGFVQKLLGEQCEPSTFDRSLPYLCGADCRYKSVFCGNGQQDPGEECDRGAENADLPNSACRSDCSLPRCGDRILDLGERCDDGNRQAGDGCDRFCQTEAAVAGKGLLGSTIDFLPGKGVYSSVPGVFPGFSNLTGKMIGDPSQYAGMYGPDGKWVPGRFLPDGTFEPGIYLPDGTFQPGIFLPDGTFVPGVYGPDGKFIASNQSLRRVPSLSQQGPPIIAIMAAGAAGGLAWMRRRRQAAA
jgi:cysteine-rich repeat protein